MKRLPLVLTISLCILCLSTIAVAKIYGEVPNA